MVVFAVLLTDEAWGGWGVRDFHGFHTKSLTYTHRIQQQTRQGLLHIHHSLFCSFFLLKQFLLKF